MEKLRRSFARVKVRALVDGDVAAEGTILAIFQPRAKP
jgi:3-hydroxymyristoyl/3-hydroxydecanoyl-(acyl carrier protein) dehydratase